jgi:hypothetical protein
LCACVFLYQLLYFLLLSLSLTVLPLPYARWGRQLTLSGGQFSLSIKYMQVYGPEGPPIGWNNSSGTLIGWRGLWPASGRRFKRDSVVKLGIQTLLLNLFIKKKLSWPKLF